MLDQFGNIAAVKALEDFLEWLKSSVHICAHGFIGATCGLCVRDYSVRNR